MKNKYIYKMALLSGYVSKINLEKDDDGDIKVKKHRNNNADTKKANLELNDTDSDGKSEGPKHKAKTNLDLNNSDSKVPTETEVNLDKSELRKRKKTKNKKKKSDDQSKMPKLETSESSPVSEILGWGSLPKLNKFERSRLLEKTSHKPEWVSLQCELISKKLGGITISDVFSESVLRSVNIIKHLTHETLSCLSCPISEELRVQLGFHIHRVKDAMKEHNLADLSYAADEEEEFRGAQIICPGIPRKRFRHKNLPDLKTRKQLLDYLAPVKATATSIGHVKLNSHMIEYPRWKQQSVEFTVCEMRELLESVEELDGVEVLYLLQHLLMTENTLHYIKENL